MDNIYGEAHNLVKACLCLENEIALFNQDVPSSISNK